MVTIKTYSHLLHVMEKAENKKLMTALQELSERSFGQDHAL